MRIYGNVAGVIHRQSQVAIGESKSISRTESCSLCGAIHDKSQMVDGLCRDCISRILAERSPMPKFRNLGERIAYLVEQSGLTNEEFSEALHMDRWFAENIIANPNKKMFSDTVIGICKFTGVSADWLLGLV